MAYKKAIRYAERQMPLAALDPKVPITRSAIRRLHTVEAKKPVPDIWAPGVGGASSATGYLRGEVAATYLRPAQERKVGKGLASAEDRRRELYRQVQARS